MGSAGWYTYDRRFAEWAERAGIELDYAVSSDLEGVEGLTDGYQLVVGAGHDEYWSGPQRDAVERFVESGGNYASFSGNTMFWQVRLVDDGAAMVCHKYSAHLDDPIASRQPAAMTGMWCDPLIGRPESRFLGASSMYGLYSRFGQATPRGVGGFVIYRDDHWMLDGTDLRYGDVLGADDGVVGYETVGTRLAFDETNLPVTVADPLLPRPPDVEIVGFTPASNLAMGEYPASIAALDDQGDLEFIAERAFGGGPDAIGEGAPRQCRDADVPAVRRRHRPGRHRRQHRLGVRARRSAGRTRHAQRGDASVLISSAGGHDRRTRIARRRAGTTAARRAHSSPCRARDEPRRGTRRDRRGARSSIAVIASNRSLLV